MYRKSEKSVHFLREGDLAQNGEVCTIDAFSTDLMKAPAMCGFAATTFCPLCSRGERGDLFAHVFHFSLFLTIIFCLRFFADGVEGGGVGPTFFESCRSFESCVGYFFMFFVFW